jgi:hypothetical protein
MPLYQEAHDITERLSYLEGNPGMAPTPYTLLLASRHQVTVQLLLMRSAGLGRQATAARTWRAASTRLRRAASVSA